MRVSHNGYPTVIYVLHKHTVLVVKVFFEAPPQCTTGIRSYGILPFFSDLDLDGTTLVRMGKTHAQPDFQES